MGMVNQDELPVTPKTQLQTLAFAIQELALYLDTHPEDKEALELYRSYQDMLHKGMMLYTEKCGPLNHKMPSGSTAGGLFLLTLRRCGQFPWGPPGRGCG